MKSVPTFHMAVHLDVALRQKINLIFEICFMNIYLEQTNVASAACFCFVKQVLINLSKTKRYREKLKASALTEKAGLLKYM